MKYRTNNVSHILVCKIVLSKVRILVGVMTPLCTWQLDNGLVDVLGNKEGSTIGELSVSPKSLYEEHCLI